MKKIIYIVILSSGFIACNNKKADLTSNREMVVLTDSTNNSSYLTDTGAVSNPEAFTGEAPLVSGKATVPAKQSLNSTRNTGTTSTGSNNNNTGSNGSTGTTTAPQKKGLSQAAKGTIFGGVGGAVAGGLIGKNAKGAIIGGAVGAAGGYVIGRSQDRKSGRVGN